MAVALAARDRLTAREGEAVVRVAPHLAAVERAHARLGSELKAVAAGGDVRCFSSLAELDAARGPIIDLIRESSNRYKGSHERQRLALRLAFLRLRTELFPSSSRKKAPRHSFVARKEKAAAVPSAPVAKRSGPRERPPPPASVAAPRTQAELDAASSARAAAAMVQAAAAQATAVAERAARNALTAQQLASPITTTSAGPRGAIAVTTCTAIADNRAAVCYSTTPCVDDSGAGTGASGEQAEGEVEPIAGRFVQRLIGVPSNKTAEIVVANSDICVTVLEVPPDAVCYLLRHCDAADSHPLCQRRGARQVCVGAGRESVAPVVSQRGLEQAAATDAGHFGRGRRRERELLVNIAFRRRLVERLLVALPALTQPRPAGAAANLRESTAARALVAALRCCEQRLVAALASPRRATPHDAARRTTPRGCGAALGKSRVPFEAASDSRRRARARAARSR